jgi:hypothetical protein
MPTARELLDQADALMRRNRSAIVDDIPVLTDSVPAGVDPHVLRGRAPQRTPTAPKGHDPIPTLTERVTPNAPKPPGAVIEEGEPSDWLQLGGAEPSIIGNAPDSIAIVPAVPEEPVVERSAVAEPEEIELTTPAEVEDAFEEEFAPAPAPVPAAPPPSATALAATFAGTNAPEPALHLIDDEVFTFDTEDEHPTIPATELNGVADEEHAQEGDEVAPPKTIDEPSPEMAAQPEQAHAVHETDAAIESAPRAVEELDEAILGAAPDLARADAAKARAEDARWESIAEEIRMQVLQRIDLFTDTGLRAQLGARLQPIVDRASADLVSTINQHVGELLRAYVAEAIEREIESWRRNS